MDTEELTEEIGELILQCSAPNEEIVKAVRDFIDAFEAAEVAEA